jgi:hypothetical protein
VRRTQEAVQHLVRHFADVPVMVFICHHVVEYPPGSGVFKGVIVLIGVVRRHLA